MPDPPRPKKELFKWPSDDKRVDRMAGAKVEGRVGHASGPDPYDDPWGPAGPIGIQQEVRDDLYKTTGIARGGGSLPYNSAAPKKRPAKFGAPK